MSNEVKKEIPYITCPSCQGAGFDAKDFPCKNCAGIGLGTSFADEFLYWGMKINRDSIFLRKIKNFLNFLINLLVFLIFVGGQMALLGWLWANSRILTFSELVSFWQIRNSFIFSFWISLFALMFLIYRIDKKSVNEAKIKQLKPAKNGILPEDWKGLRNFRRKLDISSFYKEKTLVYIEEAYLSALKLKNSELTSLHLFLALLKSLKIATLFARLNINLGSLAERLNSQLKTLPATLKHSSELKISQPVKEVLLEAFMEAYELKQGSVNELNLLLPCFLKDEILKEILVDLKINENKLNNALAWFRINERQMADYKLYRKLAGFKPGTSMDRAYTAVATPFLNAFGYDLTLAAKFGRLPLCVGRAKEIADIFEAFVSGNTGVLLTGPEGSGKKTIIEGVAREMVSEVKVPDFLRDKRLIELDVARLVSGTDATEAEGRLLRIIDEVNRAGNIVLFIENLENIMGISAGGEESLELSEVLATQLEKGFLRCLATASDKNYVKYIESTAIGRTMARLKISEPDNDRAIQMVESKISYLEARNNVFFSYNAVEAAVELAGKFIHDQALPAKAIEVIEKTAVRAASEHKKGNYICDKNDIALTINQMTEIPVQEVEEKESEKLLHLEEEIHKYMINQKEAVDMVANSLRRARTEMRPGSRPIASFLFLGPTGVGKTELAKTISRVYFHKKDLMIRLDMSEYQEQDSVKKMIGDVDGTHGYLTEAVRQKPFSLILLDEFEKAHPKIFNLFLQVMDDGRLTDGQGNTVDFSSSIIIATSNAGSNFIQDEIIKRTPIEQIKDSLINEHLSSVMRPELINRFDGIIVFKPLTEENIVAIARLMLADVGAMLKTKGMELEMTEKGVSKIAHLGYDPKFGARPLRRLIQERIGDEIAKKILSNELERRDTIIINDEAEIEIRKRKEL